MKRGLVNDAYIVLDTGDLYSTADSEALATVYIRDVNITTTSAADNKNLFLEAGSSDISKEFTYSFQATKTATSTFTTRPITPQKIRAAPPFQTLAIGAVFLPFPQQAEKA